MKLSRANIPQKILITLLFLTLCIYIATPMKGEVSMPLFYTCFALMLLSNYIYFRAKKKINYLDFDTIFLLVYCLVGFSTTFFYHDKAVFSDIFLKFPVHEEYINKSNILFLAGLQAYLIGSLVKFRRLDRPRTSMVASTTFLVVLVLVLIIVFIAAGGITYFRSEYKSKVITEDGGAVRYILLLLVASAMALIGTEFYNKKVSSNYKVSKFVFLALFSLVSMLMWAGNRTAASQILLPIICLYAFFFYNISFKKFIIFAAAGIVLMWFVQRMRTSEQSLELSNPILIILDLTLPVRSTYTALQYVDTRDYTYGSSMIIDLSGVVPFLPSFMHSLFPDLMLGSADALTNYTFKSIDYPKEFQIGLGTTIIADIYLSFGLFGVVILMYLLGFYINKWSERTLLLDYRAIVILSAMLGNAIFIVRAGYVYPARFIVWALVLASLNRFLYRAWKR